jgi:hypothetical protein
MTISTFGRGAIARFGAVLAALVLVAAAGPAAAGGSHHHWHHHHHHKGFVSFQFGTPGYYVPRSYYPPFGYHYGPRPSVRIVIPLGKRH